MRLIDAEALKKEVENLVVGGAEGLKDYYENGTKSDENSWIGGVYDAWELIDNAPTVEYPFYQEAYQTGYEEGKNERPQVNVIPQKCIKVLAETVVDVVQKIDWTSLYEKVAERPQGKWTIVDDVYCECSFCKNREVKFSKYCPECGTRLKGGAE